MQDALLRESLHPNVRVSLLPPCQQPSSGGRNTDPVVRGCNRVAWALSVSSKPPPESMTDSALTHCSSPSRISRKPLRNEQ